MKKLTVLLAVAVLTTSTVGCGCFRRLRDNICRGAFCGTPSVVSPAPVSAPAPAAAPAPVVSAPAPRVIPQQARPAPQPVYVPQPVVTNCVPCDPCCPPCCPCDPCDPCGGYGYGYGGGSTVLGAPLSGDVVESPWATSDGDESSAPSTAPSTQPAPESSGGQSL